MTSSLHQHRAEENWLNTTTPFGRSEIRTKTGTFHKTTDPVSSPGHYHKESKQMTKEKR